LIVVTVAVDLDRAAHQPAVPHQQQLTFQLSFLKDGSQPLHSQPNHIMSLLLPPQQLLLHHADVRVRAQAAVAAPPHKLWKRQVVKLSKLHTKLRNLLSMLLKNLRKNKKRKTRQRRLLRPSKKLRTKKRNMKRKMRQMKSPKKLLRQPKNQALKLKKLWMRNLKMIL